jgi:ferredoxin-NADP reductase
VKAKLIHAAHITSDIWTFRFNPEKPLSYIAGQFIELGLTLPSDSKDKPKRWFTLSSSPTEQYLEITTRIYAQQKRSDFKSALHALSLGDVVTISDSMGDFVLPKDTSLPLLFVAAGIGITPFRSMIKSLLDKNELKRHIFILHTARQADDQVFEEVFTHFTDKNYIFTTERIDSRQVLQLAHKMNEPRIYISGPEGYVERLRAELIANSYPPQQIVGDYFPGYK